MVNLKYLSACLGAILLTVITAGHGVGAVGFECSSVRRGSRLERRRVAGRRRHDHEDRYRRGAIDGDRPRMAPTCFPNLPVGPYQLKVGAAGLQHLRAGRHRAAGQLESADQRDAGGRRRQRAGHGDRQHHDGRDALHRHRPGRRQPARGGAAAQRPAGDRADLPLGSRDVRARGRPQHQQELSRR